jgi:hypothetical protein
MNSNSERVEPGMLHEVGFGYPKTRNIEFWNKERRFEYSVPTIPIEYWDQTSTGYAHIHLQVERSGEIYLVKPKAPMPAKDLSSQPSGFPLKPTNNISDSVLNLC